MVITKENKKKKKDAAIGFGVIAVIIVVIVGVVVAILPESETTQNELEENELIITDPKLDFETKKDLTKELLKKSEFALSSEKELDVVADAFVSIQEYRKTNEILEGYSTVEILVDILDDENGKITELDRRMEYHSVTESKDGIDIEYLSSLPESIEQEVRKCIDGRVTHTLEYILPGLGVDLQYLIKSGYAKDPSVTPTLNKIAKALYAYKECAS